MMGKGADGVQPRGGSSEGPATDSANNPVVDPSKNVLDLVDAAIDRQDDLRRAEAAHVRDIIGLNANHAKELRVAEAARIDAIRAVDVQAVQQAAQVQATQAQTLAATVATSAETLRTQVAAAASAATIALAAALEPVQKDIADLRRAQYEAQGVKAQTGEGRLDAAQIVSYAVLALLVLGLVATVVGLALR